MSTPLHLILLAGGQGRRAAGADRVPKQFRMTGQGPLFAVSLREFNQARPAAGWQLASVTVTAPTEWGDEVGAVLAELSLPWQLAEPGETRTASTWNAVRELTAQAAPQPDDLVAVHDAARPFATWQILNDLAAAALVHGGAIPGVPVADTVVQTGSGPAHYLPRETLVAVQTPQVFRWNAFSAAHKQAHEAGQAYTDDGGLLDAHGCPPAVVPGDTGNWKVTTGDDWLRAMNILS